MSNLNLLNHLANQYEKYREEEPLEGLCIKKRMDSFFPKDPGIESELDAMSLDDLTTLVGSCYSNPKFVNTALASHMSYSSLSSNPALERYIVSYQNECTSSYRSITSAIEKSMQKKISQKKSFSSVNVPLPKFITPTLENNRQVKSFVIPPSSQKEETPGSEYLSRRKSSDTDEYAGLVFCNFDSEASPNKNQSISPTSLNDIENQALLEIPGLYKHFDLKSLNSGNKLQEKNQESSSDNAEHVRKLDSNPPEKEWGPISNNLVSCIAETLEKCDHNISANSLRNARIRKPPSKIAELTNFIFEVTDYLYINCLTGTVIAMYACRLLESSQKSFLFGDGGKSLFLSLLILAIKMASPKISDPKTLTLKNISKASNNLYTLKQLIFFETEALKILDYSLWVSYDDMRRFIASNTYAYLDAVLSYHQYEARLEKRKEAE